MRPKSTVVLLVIAALAVAYYFLFEQPRHKQAVDRATHAQALTLLEPGNITGMSIQRPDVTLEFERRTGEWRMLEPATDKADPRSLNTLLQQITKSRIDKRFSVETTGFGAYGLDDPAAVIRLSTDSGDDPLVLHIGDFNLTKDRCFARIETAPNVLLLPAGIRRSASLSVFEFRDKRIFERPVAGIRHLKTISNGRTLDWTRDNNDFWFAVLMEDTIRGHATRIDNIVRELRGLRAKDIPFPISNSDIYFQNVAGTIYLWSRDEEDSVAITFAEESSGGGTCFVKTSQTGRVSLVESTVLRVFDNTYNRLRDRRLLEFEPDRVARIAMRGPTTEVTILRSGSDWTFLGMPMSRLGSRTSAAGG